MLGVFLFFLLFMLVYLLLQSRQRQMAKDTSAFNATMPIPAPEESSKDTANGMAWWVKIVTETPHCTYFFGPFESSSEAKQNQSGYVEDLEQEGAQGIGVLILQDQPETLTIYDEQE